MEVKFGLDKVKTKKKYPTKGYIRFITYLVFGFFTKFYRIKKIIPKEVKSLKSPYLLLGNHVGYWDPFVIGHLLPRFTHFVSSDAVFRNPLLRFFLTRLGTIPKKKNIRDTKVIRDIVSVIKQGENVGLFPEAVRNWCGETQPMDKSIAKLIKLLKVPVVVAVLKGMNLFNPRWSPKVRKAKVEVEYKLLLTEEQIVHLSEDEIFKILTKGIYHNEVDYQREKMIKIQSNRKAEYINYTLYICPQCNAIDSFRAGGNDFYCNKCNYHIHIDNFGFFHRKTDGKLYFDNIRDWFNWQETWFYNVISKKYEENFEDELLRDTNSKVYLSKENSDYVFIGEADILLFKDKIELKFKDKKQILFNFSDLQTINPQVNEKLEIYYDHEAYRIIGGRNGVSALKWEVAMNAIWRKQGQGHKLSPYISSNFC